jgi:hypothetical protein
VTELPPVASPKEAVAEATARGAPHDAAVSAATEASSNRGFDWQKFWTVLGASLAGLGGNPAGIKLAGQMIGRLQDRRAQEAAGAATATATQIMTQEFAAASGDPVQQKNALARAFRKITADGGLMAAEPDLIPQMLELANAIGTGAPDMSTHEEKLRAAGIEPGTPEAREFLLGRPPAPAAVFKEAPAEKELSIQKARADAQRIYTDIPAMRRELRGQQQNAGAMIQLLEAGTETGQWPDAVKRAVRDRFGIDTGLDPALETLSTMAGQQMLTEAQQLKGSFSDRDVRLIESLTASPGRGREANIAVLRARQEVLQRLDQEAELEEQYFDRNQTRAGFEQWLQEQDLGPVFSQEAVQEITKSAVSAERQHGQLLHSLDQAIASADKAAVDRALVALGSDRVKLLPKRLRDAARAILEGK